MDLPLDFRDLLEEFARAGVDCVLVGGYAVGFHARPRATKDLDLLLASTPQNLERTATALARFGAPESVVMATRSMQDSDIVFLGQPPLRGDLAVRVIALDDLIANKRAAGRPQDLADVRVLERVRDRKQKGPARP